MRMKYRLIRKDFLDGVTLFVVETKKPFRKWEEYYRFTKGIDEKEAKQIFSKHLNSSIILKGSR